MQKIIKRAECKVRLHVILTDKQVASIKKIAIRNDSNAGRELRRILAAVIAEDRPLLIEKVNV